MAKRSLELNQGEEEGDGSEEKETHDQGDTDINDYGAEEVEKEAAEDPRKKILIRSLPAVVSYYNTLSCQVDDCDADLTAAKRYHRRHKVCERQAKAAVVLVDDVEQRFCQRCSRFHEISSFDDARRSCRERLAGHNERRRRSNPDVQLQAENGQKSSVSKMNGSSVLKPTATGQPDSRDLSFHGSSCNKHFRIR